MNRTHASLLPCALRPRKLSPELAAVLPSTRHVPIAHRRKVPQWHVRFAFPLSTCRAVVPAHLSIQRFSEILLKFSSSGDDKQWCITRRQRLVRWDAPQFRGHARGALGVWPPTHLTPRKFSPSRSFVWLEFGCQFWWARGALNSQISTCQITTLLHHLPFILSDRAFSERGDWTMRGRYTADGKDFLGHGPVQVDARHHLTIRCEIAWKS